jgi:uncharacterized glyoxalase superfamily protein PhnB
LAPRAAASRQTREVSEPQAKNSKSAFLDHSQIAYTKLADSSITINDRQLANAKGLLGLLCNLYTAARAYSWLNNAAHFRPAYLTAMLKNRSVPVDTILPHITYKNLAPAIDWLSATFGFVEHYRYGDPVQGAQMHLSKAFIMVNAARPGRSSPIELGSLGSDTQSLTIFIEDVESHYAHSRADNANIVEELHETIYGELQYGVEDLEGHHWLFARHARDVSPDAWGATIANPYA